MSTFWQAAGPIWCPPGGTGGHPRVGEGWSADSGKR
jgi:hypothetical protein